MRIGSLCSGYGGLDMAVEATFGAETAWFCEYDADPSRILAHHWPHIPNHGDVKATDWTQVEPVDIITAGYPCPPFSIAGNRKGADDPRHLWPDVAAAISVLRPGLAVLENVAGHLTLGLDAVLGDLASLGYDATWGVVRASDAGAPHRRERVFLVATDTTGVGRGEGWPESAGRLGRTATVVGRAVVPDSDGDGHGPRSDAGVGRLARRDAGATWERKWSRPLVGDRGAAVASDADEQGPQGREPAWGRDVSTWGAYGSAIARWERVLGRRAPRPTGPGRRGERLSPRFVEWLMGLPEGHVTDVPGLSRNAQLKALGNGVVPQQAALALRLLTDRTEAAA